tara:strand:+ start:955 stop:1533 length:579 start_codon:yes stop_codon:yes gene_type:complete
MKRLISKIIPALLVFGCAAELKTSEAAEEDIITWDACSQTITDHPCDFSLVDQHGEDWGLYNNIGRVIILDFSTEWCGACHAAAITAQEIQDEYEDYGVLYVTILVEDAIGNPGSPELVEKWSNHYGMTTAPVLAGDRSMLDTSGQGLDGWPITSWPSFFVITEDMILSAKHSGFSEASIRALVERGIADSQ